MQDKKIRIGDNASVSKTITEQDVCDFAKICGDFNPVHMDEEAAGKTRFGARVCHGMLVASFISTVLGMYLPGPGSIYLEQSLQFCRPVYIGDTVTAYVIVEAIEDNIVRLSTSVLNQERQEVVKGTAKVMV